MDSNTQAILTCAGYVANIEGLFDFPVPSYDRSSLTLGDIEPRVRILEARCSVTSPPPGTAATWASVSWRICRMRRVARGALLAKQGHYILDMVPDPESIQIDELRGAMRTILRSQLYVPFNKPWLTIEDDADVPQLIQILCYAIGNHGHKLENVPLSIPEAYDLAVDISLRSEKGGVFLTPTHTKPPPPPPVAIQGPPGWLNKQNCQGHHTGIRPPPPPNRSTKKRKPTLSELLRKRDRGPAWKRFLRMLFCRRHRPAASVGYDTSSSSMTSKGTLIYD